MRSAGRAAAVAALILTSLTAQACIGGMGRVGDPFARSQGLEGGQLEVEVQNLNFNDLMVFAVKHGQQIRLGSVTGKSEGRFVVDWDFAVPVQFRIDLVGGQSCRIRDLAVDPGARVWVQVPADVSLTPCRASRR